MLIDMLTLHRHLNGSRMDLMENSTLQPGSVVLNPINCHKDLDSPNCVQDGSALYITRPEDLLDPKSVNPGKPRPIPYILSYIRLQLIFITLLSHFLIPILNPLVIRSRLNRIE